MNNTILDSIEAVKKLDSQNMLGSLELLSAQVAEVAAIAKKVAIPATYKKCNAIVVLGMGGSALGARIIKTVFAAELKAPLEIVNNYRVPKFVNKNTLVVVSSYSGTTEESIAGLKEALKRKAKVVIITSGGELQKAAARSKIPALVFTTNNNPCGSPRMGLGYSIVGQIALFAKMGALPSSVFNVNAIITVLKKFDAQFGVSNVSQNNTAKQIALSTDGRSVWYVASEHLGGSVHAAANQMNENAKRFAGSFLIPELNHHLMEGMMQPHTNSDSLLFVLIESALYDKRVQKRFAVTHDVLTKNNIRFVSYTLTEKTKLGQALEMLVLGSYVSYYAALIAGIDPTAIPFVDFFKAALKK